MFMFIVRCFAGAVVGYAAGKAVGIAFDRVEDHVPALRKIDPVYRPKS